MSAVSRRRFLQSGLGAVSAWRLAPPFLHRDRAGVTAQDKGPIKVKRAFAPGMSVGRATIAVP